MTRIFAFDIPTRLFHWIMATLFISAYMIVEFVDSEEVLFSYHMILGLTLAVAVILRIIWGFLGSEYARFTSLHLNPKDAINYFLNLHKSKTLYAGHNPASSWILIIMILLALGLASTGTLMALDVYKSTVEEIHELLADAFLFSVIAHILGIIIHTVLHKDPIALAMIHGQKSTTENANSIRRSHWAIGILFIVLIGLSFYTLRSNFNPETKVLELLGTSLDLGG